MSIRQMSVALCLGAAVAAGIGAQVFAQQAAPPPPDPICASFQKTDKQWCATKRVTMNGPRSSTELGPGACISRSGGIVVNGVDIGAELNRRCP
jgi:hypothetical protein